MGMMMVVDVFHVHTYTHTHTYTLYYAHIYKRSKTQRESEKVFFRIGALKNSNKNTA